MSKTVITTIKSDTEALFGVSCHYPIMGEVTFNAEGEFETDKTLEEIDKFISLFPVYKFYIAGEDKKTPTAPEKEDPPTSEEDDEEDEKELNKTETDELNNEEDQDIGSGTEEGTEELEKSEKDAFIASLQEKKRAELEELCKPFPGSEWRGKNKELLIKYLTEKIID